MRLSGSLVLSASAADIIEPADPDTPLLQREPLEPMSVAVGQEMLLMPDKRHHVSLGYQMVTKRGLGGSTLRIGFKRVL